MIQLEKIVEVVVHPHQKRKEDVPEMVGSMGIHYLVFRSSLHDLKEWFKTEAGRLIEKHMVSGVSEVIYESSTGGRVVRTYAKGSTILRKESTRGGVAPSKNQKSSFI